MILSDVTLKEYISKDILTVSPLDEDAIQPGSIDCRLGSHYLVIENTNKGVLSMSEPIEYREINGDSIVIAPHSFILATTMEYIKLPDSLSAFVEGRSSIGRMGLFIQNAGWVDAGFEGKITLELYNANSLPIRLDTGRRICQLVFCKMDQSPERPYSGKYQGQSQSMGSKIHMDTDVHGTSVPR